MVKLLVIEKMFEEILSCGLEDNSESIHTD